MIFTPGDIVYSSSRLIDVAPPSIQFEKLLMQVKIPPQHSGKAFPVLKSAGTMKNEQWLNDGSLQVEVEVLAGVKEEFEKKLADATKGEFETKVLRREDA